MLSGYPTGWAFNDTNGFRREFRAFGRLLNCYGIAHSPILFNNKPNKHWTADFILIATPRVDEFIRYKSPKRGLSAFKFSLISSLTGIDWIVIGNHIGCPAIHLGNTLRIIIAALLSHWRARNTHQNTKESCLKHRTNEKNSTQFHHRFSRHFGGYGICDEAFIVLLEINQNQRFWGRQRAEFRFFRWWRYLRLSWAWIC